jgi:methionyl-tRNA synthetase
MEAQEKTTLAIKPEITFDEFMKLDIRLCLITSVEKVEGKDKLYKLEIYTGVDKRVVVSAIAHKIEPQKLKWRTIPFVLNLAPRKIAGIESQGMIIMAETTEGNYIQLESSVGAKGVGASVI